MATGQPEQGEEQGTLSDLVGRVRLKPDEPATNNGPDTGMGEGGIAQRIVIGLGAVLLMIGGLLIILYGVFQVGP